MTKEELEATHPDYNAYINDWGFWKDSYYGGSAYKNGGYLKAHPFESDTGFARRKDVAYFYNYCKPIIDIYVSHLFRKKPVRDFGSLENDVLFQSFLKDANLEGDTFDQFMSDAQRFASIYGRVSILVDMPNMETISQAQNVEEDIRPYITLISPENVMDWSEIRLDNGRVVLDEVKIWENGRYRIWDRVGWTLWEVQEGEKESKVIKVDEGEHNLGVVPLVNLYNVKSRTPFIGLSDIQDIADINKNIYYLCSDSLEIIENTAYPMLAIPMQKATQTQDGGNAIKVGPKNIQQFDPSEPNSKPFWLEAPHSSLSEIREWVTQNINEIHRIAKLGGVRGTEDFAQARSGVALQLEQQQLHTTLSEKADNLEQAENMILSLWALWVDKTFDGNVDYPDEFSIADLDSDLNRLILARGQVKSETFEKEREKKVVDSTLPKLNKETQQKIDAEIEESQVVGIVTTNLDEELGIEETPTEET